ncbi:MAG: spore coat associated protein CotJA [Firmicutes bacterium]|nr:spore coat associated protein CotJA [Bacillota bacterium]
MKIFSSYSSNQKELARIYIVYQKAGKLYPPSEALSKGTVFPELYQPYKPNKKG